MLLLRIIFAAISVVGQVGLKVSLPLWTGATGTTNDPNCTNATTKEIFNGTASGNYRTMDPFFVLSFASLSFVIIFGIITTILGVIQLLVNACHGRRVLSLITVEDDLRFPQWQLILIGVFNALNGVVVVFSSVPSRTAPFLQAILGNFIIPLTIVIRFILLRKRPTLLKLLCAIAVFLGLFLSLIPVMSGLDKDSTSGNQDYLSQPRSSQIIWPLCFMFGFVPAAMMNVVEEMSLKDTRKVNIFYLLFWTSLYQLLVVWGFFWVDIIPHVGFVNSLKEFGENYQFALQCFFGGSECGYWPGFTGSLFIVMYVVTYLGGGLLLRYSEGATYLAIVQALVTPLAALFWSIFSRDKCSHLYLYPHAGSLTYFSIGGMIIMVPAIFLYNIGTIEKLKTILRLNKKKKSYEPLPAYSETTPLMKAAEHS